MQAIYCRADCWRGYELHEKFPSPASWIMRVVGKAWFSSYLRVSLLLTLPQIRWERVPEGRVRVQPPIVPLENGDGILFSN